MIMHHNNIYCATMNCYSISWSGCCRSTVCLQSLGGRTPTDAHCYSLGGVGWWPRNKFNGFTTTKKGTSLRAQSRCSIKLSLLEAPPALLKVSSPSATTSEDLIMSKDF